jgi:hypothetical protein
VQLVLLCIALGAAPTSKATAASTVASKMMFLARGCEWFLVCPQFDICSTSGWPQNAFLQEMGERCVTSLRFDKFSLQCHLQLISQKSTQCTLVGIKMHSMQETGKGGHQPAI